MVVFGGGGGGGKRGRLTKREGIGGEAKALDRARKSHPVEAPGKQDYLHVFFQAEHLLFIQLERLETEIYIFQDGSQVEI
jgi:hypothetical protein